MSGGEIAAIIAAIGTLLGVGIAGTITAIAALRNSNYNAIKITDVEERLEQSEKERRTARKRIRFLEKILMDRESEINRLLSRDKRWSEWGDTVGKLINQLQLEVGALHMQLRKKEEHEHMGDTQPIPAVPRPPNDERPEDN